MAVTDAELLAEIIWRTVEDSTFTSGLWTLAEITAYANERQNRFNRDTKLLPAHQPLAFVAGQESASLPPDWIATQRAVWIEGGVGTPVVPSSRFAADNGLSSTNNLPTRPQVLDDHSAAPLTIELFPPPIADGSLDLLYATVLETLHFDPLAPDILDLPDDFAPFV